MEYIESKYFSYADPDDPFFRKILIRSIEYCSGNPKYLSFIENIKKNPSEWESFWDGCALIY